MANNIKLTFLGTAASIPTASRNHTSILLTYQGENILVDCGEGTQRQFRKANLNPCKITRMLITHWHGDHVLGVPGLLQTLALSGYNKTIYLYGPKGTKDFLNKITAIFAFVDKLNIEVKEVKDGKFFESEDFYLEAKPMTHWTHTNAYCFVKKGERRIDKIKLKKSKLPSGPLLQQLKEGKDITFNGKKFLSKNLTYKDEDRKVSIVLDTSMNERIVPFVKNSDLLILDSSFGSDMEEKAKEHMHMTSKQTAEIAKKSKSKKLVLVHVSPRYERDINVVLNDAKKVFKNSVLVNDLDVIEI
ncbi:MAG: ribonuclease Z [Nanoarchaeota archaeon]